MKRFKNQRIKRKAKQKIFVLGLLVMALFILFSLSNNKDLYLPKIKFFYFSSLNSQLDQQEFNFFFQEIYSEKKKMQMYHLLEYTNMDLRKKVKEIREPSIEVTNELQSLKLDEQTVYITFDDGPTAYTKDIIDLLEAYEMKATFFMLEPRIRRYKESVMYLIEKGHQPALHGVTHRLDKFYESKDSVVLELNLTNQTLFELTGTTSSVIRTPYGSYPHMKDEYFHAISENGYYLFDWTIDSLDWKYKSEQYVWYTISQLENKESLKNRPKVILLHDRKSTYLHLEKLLMYLKSQGYQTEIIDYRYVGYSF